jgi:hypothetical protein
MRVVGYIGGYNGLQKDSNKTTVRGIPMWSPTIVLTSRYTA